MSAPMVKELELIKQFRDISFVCEVTPGIVKLGMLKLTSQMLEEIKEGQKTYLELVDRLTLINQEKEVDFRINKNGIIRF